MLEHFFLVLWSEYNTLMMVDCTIEALLEREVAAFCAKRFGGLVRVEVDGISPIDQRITVLFHYFHISSTIFNMPARLTSLPAVIRGQVFETCLSKRSFSVSSNVSGHENPLVSGHQDGIGGNI